MHNIDKLETVPASPSPSNINPFTFIHNSIRLVLAELLVELGQTDLADTNAVQRVTARLEEVLTYCERHLEHEERIVRPACAGRFALDVFDQGHPEQERFVAELRSLSHGLRNAAPVHAYNMGQQLHLHYGRFVAECLQHMAEEEQVLAPLILRTVSEGEMAAVQAAIAGSMSAVEAAQAAYLMIIAANPFERRLLVEKLLMHTPHTQVLGIIQRAQHRLDAACYHELVNLLQKSAPHDDVNPHDTLRMHRQTLPQEHSID